MIEDLIADLSGVVDVQLFENGLPQTEPHEAGAVTETPAEDPLEGLCGVLADFHRVGIRVRSKPNDPEPAKLAAKAIRARLLELQSVTVGETHFLETTVPPPFFLTLDPKGRTIYGVNARLQVAPESVGS